MAESFPDSRGPNTRATDAKGEQLSTTLLPGTREVLAESSPPDSNRIKGTASTSPDPQEAYPLCSRKNVISLQLSATVDEVLGALKRLELEPNPQDEGDDQIRNIFHRKRSPGEETDEATSASIESLRTSSSFSISDRAVGKGLEQYQNLRQASGEQQNRQSTAGPKWLTRIRSKKSERRRGHTFLPVTSSISVNSSLHHHHHHPPQQSGSLVKAGGLRAALPAGHRQPGAAVGEISWWKQVIVDAWRKRRIRDASAVFGRGIPSAAARTGEFGVSRIHGGQGFVIGNISHALNMPGAHTLYHRHAENMDIGVELLRAPQGLSESQAAFESGSEQKPRMVNKTMERRQHLASSITRTPTLGGDWRQQFDKIRERRLLNTLTVERRKHLQQAVTTDTQRIRRRRVSPLVAKERLTFTMRAEQQAPMKKRHGPIRYSSLQSPSNRKMQGILKPAMSNDELSNPSFWNQKTYPPKRAGTPGPRLLGAWTSLHAVNCLDGRKEGGHGLPAIGSQEDEEYCPVCMGEAALDEEDVIEDPQGAPDPQERFIRVSNQDFDQLSSSTDSSSEYSLDSVPLSPTGVMDTPIQPPPKTKSPAGRQREQHPMGFVGSDVRESVIDPRTPRGGSADACAVEKCFTCGDGKVVIRIVERQVPKQRAEDKDDCDDDGHGPPPALECAPPPSSMRSPRRACSDFGRRSVVEDPCARSCAEKRPEVSKRECMDKMNEICEALNKCGLCGQRGVSHQSSSLSVRRSVDNRMPTPEGSCIDAHEDSTTAAHQGNWQQHISSEVAENRKRNGGASSNKPAAPGKIVYKKSAVRSSVYGSQLDAPAATPGVHKKSWTLRVNDDGDLELDQSGQRASEVRESCADHEKFCDKRMKIVAVGQAVVKKVGPADQHDPEVAYGKSKRIEVTKMSRLGRHGPNFFTLAGGLGGNGQQQQAEQQQDKMAVIVAVPASDESGDEGNEEAAQNRPRRSKVSSNTDGNSGIPSESEIKFVNMADYGIQRITVSNIDQKTSDMGKRRRKSSRRSRPSLGWTTRPRQHRASSAELKPMEVVHQTVNRDNDVEGEPEFVRDLTEEPQHAWNVQWPSVATRSSRVRATSGVKEEDIIAYLSLSERPLSDDATPNARRRPRNSSLDRRRASLKRAVGKYMRKSS